jgi:hypothetical protein
MGLPGFRQATLNGCFFNLQQGLVEVGDGGWLPVYYAMRPCMLQSSHCCNRHVQLTKHENKWKDCLYNSALSCTFQIAITWKGPLYIVPVILYKWCKSADVCSIPVPLEGVSLATLPSGVPYPLQPKQERGGLNPLPEWCKGKAKSWENDFQIQVKCDSNAKNQQVPFCWRLQSPVSKATLDRLHDDCCEKHPVPTSRC